MDEQGTAGIDPADDEAMNDLQEQGQAEGHEDAAAGEVTEVETENGGTAEIVPDAEETERSHPDSPSDAFAQYATNGKDYVATNEAGGKLYGRVEDGIQVYLSTKPRPGAIYPETPAADGEGGDADSKGAGEGS